MDEVLVERDKRARKEPELESQNAFQPTNIASELTLIMLFPLLESQAKTDHYLKIQIISLLTEFFKNSPPMSIKGPKAQLDKIEYLLIKWAKEDGILEAKECLVTLGCARNSVETLIRIFKVFIITQTESIPKLNGLLSQVLKLDYEDQQPQVLDIHYHQCGFHYNAK